MKEQTPSLTPTADAQDAAAPDTARPDGRRLESLKVQELLLLSQLAQAARAFTLIKVENAILKTELAVAQQAPHSMQ
ncbi:hypothetical protein HaLaN_22328, partial [Haematococcus lacustris]